MLIKSKYKHCALTVSKSSSSVAPLLTIFENTNEKNKNERILINIIYNYIHRSTSRWTILDGNGVILQFKNARLDIWKRKNSTQRSRSLRKSYLFDQKQNRRYKTKLPPTGREKSANARGDTHGTTNERQAHNELWLGLVWILFTFQRTCRCEGTW